MSKSKASASSTSSSTSKPPEFPNLLITVGTTKYDDLITWAQSPQTIQFFKKWKTQHVKLQIGSSSLYSPGIQKLDSITYEFYNFKPSLAEDIKWADLVISHAGVGTVIDVLDSEKPLFLIPNQSLMDNHQMELGESLSENGYALYSSSIDGAYEVMEQIQEWTWQAYPKKNPQPFLHCLEQVMN